MTPTHECVYIIKRDIAVLLQADTDYQTLVFVMDRVRSFKAVQGLDVVDAELFPVISLGDSPHAVGAPLVAGAS